MFLKLIHKENLLSSAKYNVLSGWQGLLAENSVDRYSLLHVATVFFASSKLVFSFSVFFMKINLDRKLGPPQH